MPTSVAQGRSLKFQTAVGFELSFVSLSGSHMSIPTDSSPLVSSEIVLHSLVQSLGKLVGINKSKIRGIYETNSVLFKSQCSQLVFSEPQQGDVRAALCPPLLLLKHINEVYLFSCLLFLCVCVHACVSLCVLCVCRSLQRPKEGVGTPGTGVVADSNCFLY